MNVILCGYNWTGCKALQYLLDLKYNIFVYTHGNPSHIPSLIEMCKANGVDYSTENISKVTLPFEPDIICSIYYRYIIKEHIIEAYQGKIFNLHPALIPKYRGCSSLTWALINGEEFAGFTFHYINKGIDTGRIILQEKVRIESFDTQATLYKRAMFKAMEAFPTTLDKVIANYKGREQDGEVSYYKRGCPHDGIINPNWDEKYIKRFIRAMIYPPYPPAFFQGKEVYTYEDYLKLKA